jgi:hypothetical protein
VSGFDFYKGKKKMLKLKTTLVLCSISLLGACQNIPMGPAKATLNVQSAKVEMTTESPSSSCKRLDLVTYSYFKGTFFSCDFEDAQNTMKNQAAKLGGNYVKLIGINDAGVRCQGSGEAYLCPAKH